MTPVNAVEISVLLFPIFVLGLGAAFRARQNKGDIVGGDISWPKSLWLAYTVMTWFVLPALLIALVGMNQTNRSTVSIWPTTLVMALKGHLLSWWLRGPLELMMIYKWFNWSPRYGIAHDLGHAAFLLLTIATAFFTGEIAGWTVTPLTATVALYIFVTFFMTMAEALFALLFLNERRKGEDLLYFASDDPRWQMINRITTTVVIIAYGHLFFQSLLVAKNLYR